MAGRHDEEEDYMRDIDTLSQEDVEVRVCVGVMSVMWCV